MSDPSYDGIAEDAQRVCETQSELQARSEDAERAIDTFERNSVSQAYDAFVFHLSVEGWRQAAYIATAMVAVYESMGDAAAERDKWLDRANVAQDVQDLGNRGA